MVEPTLDLYRVPEGEQGPSKASQYACSGNLSLQQVEADTETSARRGLSGGTTKPKAFPSYSSCFGKLPVENQAFPVCLNEISKPVTEKGAQLTTSASFGLKSTML